MDGSSMWENSPYFLSKCLLLISLLICTTLADSSRFDKQVTRSKREVVDAKTVGNALYNTPENVIEKREEIPIPSSTIKAENDGVIRTNKAEDATAKKLPETGDARSAINVKDRKLKDGGLLARIKTNGDKKAENTKKRSKGEVKIQSNVDVDSKAEEEDESLIKGGDHRESMNEFGSNEREGSRMNSRQSSLSNDPGQMSSEQNAEREEAAFERQTGVSASNFESRSDQMQREGGNTDENMEENGMLNSQQNQENPNQNSGENAKRSKIPSKHSKPQNPSKRGFPGTGTIKQIFDKLYDTHHATQNHKQTHVDHSYNIIDQRPGLMRNKISRSGKNRIHKSPVHSFHSKTENGSLMKRKNVIRGNDTQPPGEKSKVEKKVGGDIIYHKKSVETAVASKRFCMEYHDSCCHEMCPPHHLHHVHHHHRHIHHEDHQIVLHRPGVIYHPAPTVVHRPDIIIHRPPLLVHRPVIVVHQPPVILHRPPVYYKQPDVVFHTPHSIVREPTIYSHDMYTHVPHLQQVDSHLENHELTTHIGDQCEGHMGESHGYGCHNGLQGDSYHDKGIGDYYNTDKYGEVGDEEDQQEDGEDTRSDIARNHIKESHKKTPFHKNVDKRGKIPPIKPNATKRQEIMPGERYSPLPQFQHIDSPHHIEAATHDLHTPVHKHHHRHLHLNEQNIVLHRPGVIYHPSPTVVHRPIIVIHRPPLLVHRPSIVVHQPPVVIHRPPVYYKQPDVVFHTPPPEVHEPMYQSHDLYKPVPRLEHVNSRIETTETLVHPVQQNHGGELPGVADAHNIDTDTGDHLTGETGEHLHGQHYHDKGLGDVYGTDNYGDIQGESEKEEKTGEARSNLPYHPFPKEYDYDNNNNNNNNPYQMDVTDGPRDRDTVERSQDNNNYNTDPSAYGGTFGERDVSYAEPYTGSLDGRTRTDGPAPNSAQLYSNTQQDYYNLHRRGFQDGAYQNQFYRTGAPRYQQYYTSQSRSTIQRTEKKKIHIGKKTSPAEKGKLHAEVGSGISKKKHDIVGSCGDCVNDCHPPCMPTGFTSISAQAASVDNEVCTDGDNREDCDEHNICDDHHACHAHVDHVSCEGCGMHADTPAHDCDDHVCDNDVHDCHPSCHHHHALTHSIHFNEHEGRHGSIHIHEGHHAPSHGEHALLDEDPCDGHTCHVPVQIHSGDGLHYHTANLPLDVDCGDECHAPSSHMCHNAICHLVDHLDEHDDSEVDDGHALETSFPSNHHCEGDTCHTSSPCVGSSCHVPVHIHVVEQNHGVHTTSHSPVDEYHSPIVVHAPIDGTHDSIDGTHALMDEVGVHGSIDTTHSLDGFHDGTHALTDGVHGSIDTTHSLDGFHESHQCDAHNGCHDDHPIDFAHCILPYCNVPEPHSGHCDDLHGCAGPVVDHCTEENCHHHPHIGSIEVHQPLQTHHVAEVHGLHGALSTSDGHLSCLGPGCGPVNPICADSECTTPVHVCGGHPCEDAPHHCEGHECHEPVQICGAHVCQAADDCGGTQCATKSHTTVHSPPVIVHPVIHHHKYITHHVDHMPCECHDVVDCQCEDAHAHGEERVKLRNSTEDAQVVVSKKSDLKRFKKLKKKKGKRRKLKVRGLHKKEGQKDITSQKSVLELKVGSIKPVKEAVHANKKSDVEGKKGEKMTKKEDISSSSGTCRTPCGVTGCQHHSDDNCWGTPIGGYSIGSREEGGCCDEEALDHVMGDVGHSGVMGDVGHSGVMGDVGHSGVMGDVGHSGGIDTHTAVAVSEGAEGHIDMDDHSHSDGHLEMDGQQHPEEHMEMDDSTHPEGHIEIADHMQPDGHIIMDDHSTPEGHVLVDDHAHSEGHMVMEDHPESVGIDGHEVMGHLPHRHDNMVTSTSPMVMEGHIGNGGNIGLDGDVLGHEALDEHIDDRSPAVARLSMNMDSEHAPVENECSGPESMDVHVCPHETTVYKRPSIVVPQPPDVIHRPDIVVHRAPIVIHRRPVVYHQSPVIVHKPPIIVHQAPIVVHPVLHHNRIVTHHVNDYIVEPHAINQDCLCSGQMGCECDGHEHEETHLPQHVHHHYNNETAGCSCAGTQGCMCDTDMAGAQAQTECSGCTGSECSGCDAASKKNTIERRNLTLRALIPHPALQLLQESKNHNDVKGKTDNSTLISNSTIKKDVIFNKPSKFVTTKKKKKDVVVSRPPIIYHPPPEIYHRPDIVVHRPPLLIHRPSIIYHQPPVIVHRPAVVYHQPPLVFHQPPPAVQQPLLVSHDTFRFHPSAVYTHMGSVVNKVGSYVGVPHGPIVNYPRTPFYGSTGYGPAPPSGYRGFSGSDQISYANHQGDHEYMPMRNLHEGGDNMPMRNLHEGGDKPYYSRHDENRRMDDSMEQMMEPHDGRMERNDEPALNHENEAVDDRGMPLSREDSSMEHRAMMEHGNEADMEHRAMMEHGNEAEMEHRAIMEHENEAVMEHRAMMGHEDLHEHENREEDHGDDNEMRMASEHNTHEVPSRMSSLGGPPPDEMNNNDNNPENSFRHLPPPSPERGEDGQGKW